MYTHVCVCRRVAYASGSVAYAVLMCAYADGFACRSGGRLVESRDTYAHACSRMLTHAHVCSRMLTYADVCRLGRLVESRDTGGWGGGDALQDGGRMPHAQTGAGEGEGERDGERERREWLGEAERERLVI